MSFLSIFAVLCLVVVAATATVPGFVSPRAATAYGWQLQDRASPSAPVRLIVALRQREGSVAQLEALLSKVADPHSPKYGQHLSSKQIEAIVAPPGADDALRALQCDRLDTQCVLSVHRDHVFLTTTVAHAEKLFGVELFSFSRPERPHGRSGTPTTTRQVIRAAARAVTGPAAASALIEFVHGLTDFPPPDTVRVDSSTAYPGNNIDPAVLRRVYGARPSKGQTSASVAEFEGEAFVQTDIDAFSKQYGLSPQQIHVVGPNNGSYSGEGILDLEYVVGTAPNVSTTFWSIKWTEFGKDLLQWALDVQAAPSPPLVHSISWGSSEAGAAAYDSATMIRTNTEFMKMGLQGLSVLVASGDGGTGNTGLLGCKQFDPSWPASSPFVTTVGGTYLTSSASTDTETAWSGSGGGFSNMWARPAWQDSAVAAYLAQHDILPAQKFFNASGRAFPDVSALSTNFQVVYGGSTTSETGTSAATPVFAAMIALVNEARAAASKPPLGFLNPALYSLGAVGVDVVAGNNKVAMCPKGFPATPGWDAVTGLGTPQYSTLVSGLA
eukprot:gnl/Spiro4/2477_TR1193_c1_g1_i1.p1 gnl/Spiro4/2477_TR1193_c1_g1~~gnl/Spiro4/2477_TR1193_c1_g1_i1.p1  ORF type:complete len:568 (+),score=155.92 gnl/Spiro4/2477_TR1193_c1_g1_i1:43-1704(+)